MYIAILGRQPTLGTAELESIYGANAVRWFSDQSATVATSSFSLDFLGGTQKAGRVVIELSSGDWRRASMKIVQTYAKEWASFTGKLTLGISAYGFDASHRDVQKTGLILKQKLKNNGVSLRLIPNEAPALNSATSHHNKLGQANNKKELIVVRARSGKIIIAESVGTQNITAYALRDQKRPKRDAFVGMLPPKLAQIMINLAIPFAPPPARVARGGAAPTSSLREVGADRVTGPADSELRGTAKGSSDDASEGKEDKQNDTLRLLDPFCGTGVILQEAALMGYHVYGTDLSNKMIDFSRENLKWLAESHQLEVHATLQQGDAMETVWQQPINAVACESYLGQPFSAPPSPSKLTEVRGNCDHIISAFLKNIADQLEPSTPLCIGIPAWRDSSGNFTHLPLIDNLERLGYQRREFKNIKPADLLYYREDQVVARELLVLVKK